MSRSDGDTALSTTQAKGRQIESVLPLLPNTASQVERKEREGNKQSDKWEKSWMKLKFTSLPV